MLLEMSPAKFQAYLYPIKYTDVNTTLCPNLILSLLIKGPVLPRNLYVKIHANRDSLLSGDGAASQPEARFENYHLQTWYYNMDFFFS